MHHAVADGRDLVDALEHTVGRVGNRFDQQVDGGLVVGTVLFMPVGLAAGNLVHDEGVADDDAFDHSLGDNLFFIPVEKLVFYR